MKYRTNDGWDLDSVCPLEEAVQAFDNMSKEIYELKNCVRTMSLVEMRDRLLEEVESMKESLEQIGDDDEVVEEECSECDKVENECEC